MKLFSSLLILMLIKLSTHFEGLHFVSGLFLLSNSMRLYIPLIC